MTASRWQQHRGITVLLVAVLLVTSPAAGDASADEPSGAVAPLTQGPLEISLVADIVPGEAASSPNELAAFRGQLFFQASAGQGSQDRPMWVSDGTPAGTTIVTGVDASRPDRPENLTVVDDQLFFSARTETDVTPKRELWVRDGATTATRRVQSGLVPAFSRGERELSAYDGRLYLVASDGSGRKLWTSDGTPEGTTPFADADGLTFLGSDRDEAPDLTVSGRNLFFVARLTVPGDRPGARLWVISDDEDGTKRLEDISPVSPAIELTEPKGLTAVGQLLYFSAANAASGRELWVTDGTVDGTGPVIDINPGVDGSSPEELTALGERLLFTANDGTNGRELWVSDSTVDNTRLVKDINPFGDSSPEKLTVVGSRVFFLAQDGSSPGFELWVTDGTSAGTVLVKDFRGSPIAPSRLVALGDRLYFTAGDDSTGRELWVSDGTEEGTTLVQDLREGPDASSPDYLTAVGDRLFFTASTEATGTELWMLRPRATGGSGSGPGAGGGLQPTPDSITTSPPTLLCAPADAASFPDVGPRSTHGPAIGCLGARAILTGFADGTFGPSLTITRGQAASVLFRSMNAAGAELVGLDSTFADVSGAHAAAIGALTDAGVITGFGDGSFRPGDPVTRGQLASMIARASQALERPLPVGTATFTDVALGSAHADAVGALVAADVVRGYPDGSFRPATDVTRGQVATMIANWLINLDA